MLKEPHAKASQVLSELTGSNGPTWHHAGPGRFRTKAGETQLTVSQTKDSRTVLTVSSDGQQAAEDLTSFPNARALYDAAAQQVGQQYAAQNALLRILDHSTYGLHAQDRSAMPALCAALAAATREERIEWHEIPDAEDSYETELPGAHAEMHCETPSVLIVTEKRGGLVGELRERDGHRKAELMWLLTQLVRTAAMHPEAPDREEPYPEQTPSNPTLWNKALQELKAENRAQQDRNGATQ